LFVGKTKTMHASKQLMRNYIYIYIYFFTHTHTHTRARAVLVKNIASYGNRKIVTLIKIDINFILILLFYH